MIKTCTKGILVPLVIGLFTTVSLPALAKSGMQVSTASEMVRVDVVKDGIITLNSDTPFTEVQVANTEIADIVALSDKSFHIMGMKRGKTSIMVYGKHNRLIDVIDVNVNYDVQDLKKILYETFPNEQIEVRPLAGKIYLSGNVRTASVSNQAEKIAQAYAEDNVTNGLIVRDSHQVMLEVRFVEATRSVIKELGVGLLVQQSGEFAFASGVGTISGGSTTSALLQTVVGPTSIDLQIDALEEEGSIRTLAEPNLIAMSGETASFLAGGEFPIPVSARNGEVTIVFRQFGVGLSFTPTVLDNGIINLKVNPEVSQLDTTNSVRVGGVEVPSLTIRRASTTVELRNSQSFAIAGLLQNTQTTSVAKTPWLADIPVLGSLFKSSRYKNKETELVIIVTPRLVQPVSDMSKLASPLDNVSSANEIDFFLNGTHEIATNSISSVGSRAQETGKQVKKHKQELKKINNPKPVNMAVSGGRSAQYGHSIQ